MKQITDIEQGMARMSFELRIILPAPILNHPVRPIICIFILIRANGLWKKGLDDYYGCNTVYKLAEYFSKLEGKQKELTGTIRRNIVSYSTLTDLRTTV